MIGRVLHVVAAALLIALGAASCSPPADRDAWLADYTHLKAELAQSYANLDWMVSHRGLDLADLDALTTRELNAAESDRAAARVIAGFIDAFGDPHLRLVDRTTPSNEATDPPPATPPADPPPVASCRAAGYRTDAPRFTLSFPRLEGWRTAPEGAFAAGVAGAAGFIRLASFDERTFGAVCERVFKSGLTRRQLQLDVRAVLQDELRSTLSALESMGARVIIVDLTGNGGGSEWASEAAALFTDRVLERRAARLALADCDRSDVWRGGPPACPGLSPEGPPSTLAGEGVWRGPVVLLTDRHTASAAEDFAVWLRENDVAQLIGERTTGAGCGYVDGGGLIRLRAGRKDVMAPNCARFLRDGTNEIEGLSPDEPVDLRETPSARMLEVLPAALLRLAPSSGAL